MSFKNAVKLIFSIAVCEVAGSVGAFFTFPVLASWYDQLLKPSMTPPDWVFGPVWTTLFALMGIALWLVWIDNNAEKSLKRRAFGIFTLQILLNILWSIVFFGLQSPMVAFIEIVFLWLSILATGVIFFRISRPASYLLLPYLLWVGFAVYLNYSIWILN